MEWGKANFELVMDKRYGGLNPVQFGRESCAPLHSFGPAVRNYWLLHYVVSGKGKFTREGQTYAVESGQCFVIPPQCKTYYEANEKEPWEYLWVGFTTTEELPEALSEPVLTMPGLGDVFQKMAACRDFECGRSAYLSSCLWQLFALLLEQRLTVPDHIEKALTIISVEYINAITVEEIAERVGLDRSYFSSLFAERVGQTPGKYITGLRMNKAVELMTTYGQTPKITAFSVGYTDLFHFSKAFKKYFGVSPRAYIKQYREKQE